MSLFFLPLATASELSRASGFHGSRPYSLLEELEQCSRCHHVISGGTLRRHVSLCIPACLVLCPQLSLQVAGVHDGGATATVLVPCWFSVGQCTNA